MVYVIIMITMVFVIIMINMVYGIWYMLCYDNDSIINFTLLGAIIMLQLLIIIIIFLIFKW